MILTEKSAALITSKTRAQIYQEFPDFEGLLAIPEADRPELAFLGLLKVERT